MTADVWTGHLTDRYAPGRAAAEPQPDERYVSGGTFILDAPKGVPAVWGSSDQVAWAKGEPLLIVGPAGVGKTTLAGQLIMARVGFRGSVLGMPVAAGERVLYLACDRPAQVQRALARLVTANDREVLDERLVIWKGPPPADFARHPDTLIRMCDRANADMVVIDSEKDVALKLSDDETGAGLNAAHQRAVAEGVEVVGLHHQRKNAAGGGKPNRLEDVYGSTWITAGAGSVILLWGDAGDPIVELSHLKQPAEPIGPFKVLHDHDHGTSQVLEQVDALTVLLRRPGLTAADLAALVCSNGRPTDNDRERARRKLERLVRDDLAFCQPGSRGGQGGGTPTRYYASARAESDHGAITHHDRQAPITPITPHPLPLVRRSRAPITATTRQTDHGCPPSEGGGQRAGGTATAGHATDRPLRYCSPIGMAGSPRRPPCPAPQPNGTPSKARSTSTPTPPPASAPARPAVSAAAATRRTG